MVRSNNSAQFWLDVITKVDRGVVRGLGEIKILQGGIPSPQTQLRAHALNTQAKMRGVNSALLRSHCKGGGGVRTSDLTFVVDDNDDDDDDGDD